MADNRFSLPSSFGLLGDRELERRLTNLNFENCKDKDVSSILECPVCLEICFPPSFVCDRGYHLLCGSCKCNGIDLCPICRSQNLDESQDLPIFLRKFKGFNCVFQTYGCPIKTLDVLDIKYHESSCIYAQMKCPCNRCMDLISVRDYHQHVMDEHSEACCNFSSTVTIKVGGNPDEALVFLMGFKKIVAFRFRQSESGISAKATFDEPNPPDDVYFEVLFQKGIKTCSWKGKVSGAKHDVGPNLLKSSFTGLREFIVSVENELLLTARVNILRYSGANLANGDCSHYKRGCFLICPETSCSAIVPCRFCHNEKIKGHKFKRFELREVKCATCGYLQSPRKDCVACKTVFGKYFCKICNLFDNANNAVSTIFHCDKCGICRKRTDASIQYFHCDNCGICGPAENHECKGFSSKGACFICKQENFDSRNEIVSLPCGHFTHKNCQEVYIRNGYPLFCLNCKN